MGHLFDHLLLLGCKGKESTTCPASQARDAGGAPGQPRSRFSSTWEIHELVNMLCLGGFEQSRLLASLAEYFWG